MNFTDPEGLFAQLFLDLYFVVFDEITVTASSYSAVAGFFFQLAGYFSETTRPSIYGELGRPTPPAAGAYRGLFEGDELERVRFGMSYGAIDTGGVPEFVIFLPMGRISKALGGIRHGVVSRGGMAVRRAPGFVVTPRGEAIPIPRGAIGPSATRAPGVQYVGGSGGAGLDSRVTGVRIMEGNSNQGSRAVYMNRTGQTVNPATGRTVPNADPAAHHYLEPFLFQ
ncbi:MAG: hypothetical protein HC897_01370 [Thermoanaerobaculia bacterium]|nr:hypothetical protein [Thermoanaerobaculia bacterium]